MSSQNKTVKTGHGHSVKRCFHSVRTSCCYSMPKTSAHQYLSKCGIIFKMVLWWEVISFSISHIYFVMPSELMCHPADADITRPTAHISTCSYQPTQNKTTDYNSWQVQCFRAVFLLFLYLSVWLSNGIMAATECSHSTEECLIWPLSTTPLTGNEMVSWWMWLMPFFFTLMSSRMTVALQFPRCWLWWCLKIELAANKVVVKEKKLNQDLKKNFVGSQFWYPNNLYPQKCSQVGLQLIVFFCCCCFFYHWLVYRIIRLNHSVYIMSKMQMFGIWQNY